VLSPCHACLDSILTFVRRLPSPRFCQNPRSVILRCCCGMQQVEKLAKGAVSVILALSLIAARADILWVGNSPLLNYSAGQKKRKQTVWLRRILLLEVGWPEHTSRAAQAIRVITNVAHMQCSPCCSGAKQPCYTALPPNSSMQRLAASSVTSSSYSVGLLIGSNQAMPCM